MLRVRHDVLATEIADLRQRIAQLESENLRQTEEILRLKSELDEKASTVVYYERTFIPLVLEGANRSTDGFLERMAKNASDLHTIMGDLYAQRRDYQATADALRNGTIRPSPSIVVAIGQQPPQATLEATLTLEDKSLSIVALPSYSATRQSPPEWQGDDHHELH